MKSYENKRRNRSQFEPKLVINAATVKYTLEAFRQVLPVLPKDCIISDIASVKTGLKKFYEESGFRYVDTSYVRPYFCQSEQLEYRKCHHHQRG